MQAGAASIRPMRVVSLLPSATETLCLVGGSDCLIGRSHECDHPSTILDRPALTAQATDFESQGAAGVDAAVSAALREGRSLYTLDAQRLARLRPDLIITQDLCDVCSIDLDTVRAVAASLDPAPTVLSLNPTTFEAVLDDLITIGRAIRREPLADAALQRLRDRYFAAAELVTPYQAQPTAAFLEWTDPLFIGGHWTPQLIERAGAAHPLNPTVPADRAGDAAGMQAASRTAAKSRRITAEDLASLDPDWLIICPCGLTLDQTRAEARALLEQPRFRALAAVRNGRVALVDGSQMFNRPGPRLVDAFEFLVGLFNDRPDVIPESFPWSRLPPLR